MRTKLSFFLCLILSQALNGQNLNIHIVDTDSKEDLPFANVYLKQSGIGASSDMQGRLSIAYSKILAGDSIYVSYIGYETEIIPVAENSQQKLLIIKLNGFSNELDEVVVRYIEPPKPKKLLKNVIKNIPLNYSTKDVIYESFYRETILEDDVYIQLNEGFIKTHYTAYPQKKLDRKIWMSWQYDESYSFDFDGNLFFKPLFKDFNTKRDIQTVVASRHSDKLSQHGIETTLMRDPLLTFAFDKVKYEYDFLNPSLFKKYDYKLLDDEIIDGELCYVLSFKPNAKKSDRKFRTDQSRKNKHPIYIGRMYINKENYSVLRFEYNLAVDRNFGFFANRVPLEYKVEMNYKRKNDLYFIKDIKFTETKVVGRKPNKEAIIHSANVELYVMDIQQEEVTPFADSTIFKSTYASNLRYYKKNYDPDYWDKIDLPNSLKPTPKMVADLSRDKSLEEQFQYNKVESKQEMSPPTLAKQKHVFNYHQRSLEDDYHWVADSKNETELKDYLGKENKYAKNSILEDKAYQRKLYNALINFYDRQEEESQIRNAGSYYFESDSLDNDILYYQNDLTTRTPIFNIDDFRASHSGSYINKIIPNLANRKVLVKYEVLGDIGDRIKVYNFGTSKEIDAIENVSSAEWISDSIYVFTQTNKIGRAGELLSRNLNTKENSLLYTEKDLTFDIEIVKENEEIFGAIQSKLDNEIYWLKNENGKITFTPIRKRHSGVNYNLRLSDAAYILVEDENNGSSFELSDLNNPELNSIINSFDKEVKVDDFIVHNKRLIASVYKNGKPQILYLEQGENKWKTLKFDLGIGSYSLTKTQKDGTDFLFSFSSPTTPFSRYAYNFETEELKVTYTSPVKYSKFYTYNDVKRHWAKSHDGKKIPITIIGNGASGQQSKGLILKVYGAYGGIMSAAFDARESVLLEEGYHIAYAHVRGGSILGNQWYKQGRQLQKEHSILDYLACAEYLIKEGICDKNTLVGYGNSAGGLTVGQAINLRPDLFNTAILDHPFLDVLNTMMDETLPLTIDEYKEWGDPNNKNVFDYMASYCPYQNVKSQNYPNVLVVASYQDFQTPAWQVAKYVSKLREHNQADSEIIFMTDMNSGHIGSTIGNEWIKHFSQVYSFAHLKIDKTSLVEKK